MYLADIQTMRVAFSCGEHDNSRNENEILSNILNDKGIDHRFDILHGRKHDWDSCKQLLPQYLSGISY